MFDAQTESLNAMTADSIAADVDIAARRVIEKAGYGDLFTHRLGHGIGIKGSQYFPWSSLLAIVKKILSLIR